MVIASLLNAISAQRRFQGNDLPSDSGGNLYFKIKSLNDIFFFNVIGNAFILQESGRTSPQEGGNALWFRGGHVVVKEPKILLWSG